ncbi:hypothetical protein PHYSODRAFT_256052 [Phytophthora sojae]|uniref:Retrotransposon gag domain-containing protein n=1 Tax=Phytophthora sojae (strain P6497) TaxID=1094619 RepID=G4Z1I1_PHYSP|nr:hypothetical protein PHYSODRAFT_256052 [Phytophthora sojae]EGZ25892.1 hypothetical protein PHYSODRAFT_256052 [Phytophthora sojae]|eukprot:XP_009521180.1 hypothetical protein PHYSODRAFT_256052 [Phytophthora sojae]
MKIERGRGHGFKNGRIFGYVNPVLVGFTGSVSPEDSVMGLTKIIPRAKIEDSAKMFHFEKGDLLPWFMARGNGEDMREEGRDGEGRGNASRQSRRSQGLPPEEHASLDEVVRAARKAGSAKRKAARKAKAKSSEEEPTPAPSVQDDAHQVSPDGELDVLDPDPKAVQVQGESVQDEPAKASAGGADEVEPPAADRVSDSPLPDQDAESKETPNLEDKPLPTVQEVDELEDSQETSPSAQATTTNPDSSVQEASTKTTPNQVVPDQAPDPGSLRSGTPDQRFGEVQEKAYVAQQVSRRERVESERVTPPAVEYSWSTPKPDAQPWMAAMLTTSRYLSARALLEGQEGGWIAELRLDRRDLSTPQDLMAVQVPVQMLTPRECMAILQALLFEAGFRFDNMVPVWFRTRAAKVAPAKLRVVIQDVLRLLALELVEWRSRVVGATFKITSVLKAQASETPESEQASIQDYHAEDQDGDLLITDYDLGLLGREYVLRLKLTGLRPARSPGPIASLNRSANNTIQPGRRTSSRGDVVQAEEAAPIQEYASSDPVPSLVGTSGSPEASLYGTMSGSNPSRNSSASSSSIGLGFSAGAHVPPSTYGPMAMSIQAGRPGFAVGGGAVGYYVTQRVVSKRAVEVDQDDVEMAESVQTSKSRTDRSRTKSSSRHRRHRYESESGSESSSESGTSSARNRRHRRSSKRSSYSKRRSSSRRSSRSGRSRRSHGSRASSRSYMSISSGVAEVAVTAMNDVKRLQAALDRMALAQQATSEAQTQREAEAQRKLEEAERRIQKSERRMAAALAGGPRPDPVQPDLDAVIPAEPGPKNIAEAQLRATIPEVDLARVTSCTKPRIQVPKAEPTPKATKAEVLKAAVPAKSGSKPPPRKPPPKPSRKKTQKDENPSSSSSISSDSSDSDSRSSDSDSSLDGGDLVEASARKIKAGETSLTIHPYVNSSALEKFDEKASLGDRRSCQGGWSNRARISELKMKMSSPVRNWRGQLPKQVKNDWKSLAGEFRKKYLKAWTSDSERYYTMKQKGGESALEYFYRLNDAAGKASINYRSSRKDVSHHVKRFIKGLKDSDLKQALKSQRFKRIPDLEFALEQDEEVTLGGGYDTPPSRTRDIRADNAGQERFKPRRTGRAFVGLDGSDSDQDQEVHVHFEDEPESKPDSPPAPVNENLDGVVRDAITESTGREDEMRKAVFRILEHSGWRPPNQDFWSGAKSPRQGDPDRSNLDQSAYCENCHEFGHRTERCWADLVCDRCVRMGHPTDRCRALLCKKCGEFHVGRCEEHNAIQPIMDLIRKGALEDLSRPSWIPSRVVRPILVGR